MKKFYLSYEVVRECEVEAKNAREAIEIGNTSGDLDWEDGEITGQIEAQEITDDYGKI